ncbi:MAG: pseudouridine synthase [Chthoniobacterales bacterium]|jgi:23S rRNA pseudouridine2605 synthase
MRLNRYLAQSGIASRRAVEEIILADRVTVNGAVCAELSRQVAPTDSVKVDGKLVRPTEPIYVLLNKPVDYVTTRSDDRSRPTIYQLLPKNFHQLAHVGRLDIDSEGLLILTNDGDLTLHLTHPRYKVSKEYLVTLDREFAMADVPKVKRGVYLAEGRARFDSLTKLNSRQVRVILTQGLTRQVRRVFAAIGYKVRRLQRTRIGPLFDTALKPGEYRLLRPAEVAKLRGRREAE